MNLPSYLALQIKKRSQFLEKDREITTIAVEKRILPMLTILPAQVTPKTSHQSQLVTLKARNPQLARIMNRCYKPIALNEKQWRFLNVRTKIKSIMLRACATIAITNTAETALPMLARTLTDLYTLRANARIATSTTTTNLRENSRRKRHPPVS